MEPSDAMRVAAGLIRGWAILATSLNIWAGDPVPDFKLLDVNTNSIRYHTPVSPRDYVLQVSGYYFGHAG